MRRSGERESLAIGSDCGQSEFEFDLGGAESLATD